MTKAIRRFGQFQQLVLLEMYLEQEDEWHFNDPWFVESLPRTENAMMLLWGRGYVEPLAGSKVFRLTKDGETVAGRLNDPHTRSKLAERKAK